MCFPWLLIVSKRSDLSMTWSTPLEALGYKTQGRNYHNKEGESVHCMLLKWTLNELGTVHGLYLAFLNPALPKTLTFTLILSPTLSSTFVRSPLLPNCHIMPPYWPAFNESSAVVSSDVLSCALLSPFDKLEHFMMPWISQNASLHWLNSIPCWKNIFVGCKIIFRLSLGQFSNLAIC